MTLPPQETAARRLQPLLHDLVSCVRAPALALSEANGQVRTGGVQGFFRSDVRVLSRLEVRVGGTEPESLRGQSLGGDRARFVGVARSVGDDADDPTVTVERQRTVHGDGVDELVVVASSAVSSVDTEVELRVACDLAPVDLVKTGLRATELAPEPAPDGGLRWSRADGTTASLSFDPPPDEHGPDGRLRWRVSLRHGDTWTVRLESRSHVPAAGGVVFDPSTQPVWARPTVHCADPALAALVEQGLDDLAGLLLAEDGDPFLAAGSPWFFTLFGRDSLWAARMLLPLGTELALGTLRVLARRQGRASDAETEEQPGKILHEVRREELTTDELTLPPVYYGTVDATPLWVTLLAEAWRWGADPDAVRPLVPAAQRALRWMVDSGDADGDGFLEYSAAGGRGLTNQGWKDSGDAIQWADGRLADGPIALSEVQGYAYEAALLGADLLEGFGVRGADEWREWAQRLAEAFRARFWVEDEDGAYPAIALDGAKRPVDSVASNMGHLVGTGLLDAAEVEAVARRLARPDMDSGFGLRTLSARSARFGPLSYHGGSVWPHDTAIAVLGLSRAGAHGPAASLTRGLLAAAPAFDFRLPELFAGEQREPRREPLPYPASCRPQAWAAASGVALLQAVTGLLPDVPRGRVRSAPLVPSPVGAVAVAGLRVAGAPVHVEVAADGSASVRGLPAGVALEG